MSERPVKRHQIFDSSNADRVEHARDETIAAFLTERECSRCCGASASQKIALQCGARAPKARFDDVFADAEHFGGLGGAHALHLPEHEHLAIAIGEIVHGGLDERADFTPEGLALRVGR